MCQFLSIVIVFGLTYGPELKMAGGKIVENVKK